MENITKKLNDLTNELIELTEKEFEAEKDKDIWAGIAVGYIKDGAIAKGDKDNVKYAVERFEKAKTDAYKTQRDIEIVKKKISAVKSLGE